jgi:hypothetical protein
LLSQLCAEKASAGTISASVLICHGQHAAHAPVAAAPPQWLLHASQPGCNNMPTAMLLHIAAICREDHCQLQTKVGFSTVTCYSAQQWLHQSHKLCPCLPA